MTAESSGPSPEASAFADVLRVGGTTPLGHGAAAEALAVLIPLVRAAPDWEPAVQAVEAVVERVEGGAVAAVADWWLVAGARRASLNKGAYLLPEEELGRHLAQWMAEVRDLDTRIPPLRWLHRNGQLATLVSRARSLLDIEAHGNVKLPSERTAWRVVVEELEPAVRSMEQGRPIPAIHLSESTLENALVEAKLERNSPLWNRFLSRARETLSAFQEAANCLAEVEPWRRHQDPGGCSSELPVGNAPLPKILAVALELPPDDPEAIGKWLEEEAATASGPDRVLLEWVSRGFRRATALRIAALDEVEARRTRLESRASDLREAGAPVDDIDLALDFIGEGLLDDADSVLADAHHALEASRRMARLQRDVEDVATLATSLPEAEARIDELKALLAAGELEQVEARLREIRTALVSAVRSQRLERVTGLIAELESLGATGPLLAEGRRMAEALRNSSLGLPGASEVEELADRVQQARADAQRRVERLIGAAEAMLEERRSGLSERTAAELAQALRSARERFVAGELRQAEEMAQDSRVQIERRQVPTWSASQGEAALVRHLTAYLTQTASFALRDILRLHVALKTKRFVILAGLTGSGKSTIARLYAEALGATVENGRLLRVAVRPNWVDETEVLGYVNPLSGAFTPGWLAILIRSCQRDPDLPFFCILDEMNLAPVEQYLADALSAMEEARSGSEDVRIPLYPPGAALRNGDEWEPTLLWPANLFLIGTVNVDETTRAISDRVLDRANVLQLSVPFGGGHHTARRKDPPEHPWMVRFSEWLRICREEPADDEHDFLVQVARVFVRMRIGLGMRSHVELERFLANAKGTLAAQEALDFGILQRIIPKVRGFKRDLAPGLRDLRDLLAARRCVLSVRVLDDWLSDEVADEAFLDGTDARVGLVAG